MSLATLFQFHDVIHLRFVVVIFFFCFLLHESYEQKKIKISQIRWFKGNILDCVRCWWSALNGNVDLKRTSNNINRHIGKRSETQQHSFSAKVIVCAYKFIHTNIHTFTHSPLSLCQYYLWTVNSSTSKWRESTRGRKVSECIKMKKNEKTHNKTPHIENIIHIHTLARYKISRSIEPVSTSTATL